MNNSGRSLARWYIQPYFYMSLALLLAHVRSRRVLAPSWIQPGTFASTIIYRTRHDTQIRFAHVTSDVQGSAKLLRDEGSLVAFPTETVYGLGANAFDNSAVLRIFEVKGRPRTDPLIVHIADTDSAASVFDFEEEPEAELVVQTLGKAFWPGPLTLVFRPKDTIPEAVTAGTGFVGVRCPRHPMARELIKSAGVPVVAPSANRFGHVSPTNVHHVLADLGEHNIIVLKPKDATQGAEECPIGIESTVAKIDVEEKKVVILRAGAITRDDLKSALKEVEGCEAYHVITHVVRHHPAEKKDTEVAQIAPGQLIKHYAPDVETLLISSSAARQGMFKAENWGDAVVIDFGGGLAHLKKEVGSYRDLSPKGDVKEAAHCLFDTMRWAEEQNFPGIHRILIRDLRELDFGKEQGFAMALIDRTVRAASGKELATSQN